MQELQAYWLTATKKGIERREGSDGGNVQQLRLPLRWELLTTGEQACEQYQYNAHRRVWFSSIISSSGTHFRIVR
jgi:hypothetical protein